MAVEMEVHEQSCRGCELCVDICPTKVFEMDAEKGITRLAHAEDCIACLSCSYLCPSGAITASRVSLTPAISSCQMPW